MDTVKIRLRKPRRVFAFLSHDVQLERDDSCIVQTDRGLEFGMCILPPEPCPEGLEKRLNMTVVRRATEDDEAKQMKIAEDEEAARKVCLKKIHKHELAMKLVDAEYTFDKRKVIFYFTAEDRIDFRELVRDLAHELRTRIEMRHIQVRDEAKMIGGIGSCGRELCCTTWLNEFKPISMKMAKRQNLSLNPSKISGQCGRLLCCLSYENELYKQSKKSRDVAKARVEAEVEVEPAPEEVTAFDPMPEVVYNRPELNESAEEPRREGEAKPAEEEPVPRIGGPAGKREQPKDTEHVAKATEEAARAPSGEKETTPTAQQDTGSEKRTKPRKPGRGRRRRGKKGGKGGKGKK